MRPPLLTIVSLSLSKQFPFCINFILSPTPNYPLLDRSLSLPGSLRGNITMWLVSKNLWLQGKAPLVFGNSMSYPCPMTKTPAEYPVINLCLCRFVCAMVHVPCIVHDISGVSVQKLCHGTFVTSQRQLVCTTQFQCNMSDPWFRQIHIS